MKNVIKLSYKNVCQNKRRSLLIGIIIGICQLTLLITGNFQIAVNNQMANRIINVDTGHIQVRNKGMIKGDDIYLTENKVNWDKALGFDSPVYAIVKKNIGGRGTICGRVSFSGMFYAYDKSARGLRIIGVEPEKEERLKKELPPHDGQFPDTQDLSGIYLSSGTAWDLDVTTGDTVSILCGTINNALNSMDFTVCGIFEDAAPWQMVNSYIHLKTAQDILDANGKIMEFKIFLNENADTQRIASQMQKDLSGAGLDADVKTWDKAGEFYLQSLKGTDFVIIVIYAMLFVIIFGVILDTMVLIMRERVRETGIMRALGTTNLQIIKLYAGEIVILSGFSIIISTIVSMGIIAILGKIGIGGTDAFKYMISGSRIFLSWSWDCFISSSIKIFIITIFAALFPIRRSLKTEVVDTLRSI